MFYCGKCNKITKPGEKEEKEVIETRHKKYYDAEGQEQGSGNEIAKEIKVCPRCMDAKE